MVKGNRRHARSAVKHIARAISSVLKASCGLFKVEITFAGFSAQVKKERVMPADGI